MNHRLISLVILMFVSLPALAQTPPFDVRLRTIIGGTMQWTSTIDPSWVEFEETAPGSNVWMITLADTSANDPNTTWTFTGTGSPLPNTHDSSEPLARARGWLRVLWSAMAEPSGPPACAGGSLGLCTNDDVGGSA